MEIQVKAKDLPEQIKKLGISPEDFVRLIIDDEKVKTEPIKDRWKKAAERIAQNPLSEEAAEHLRKASRELRGSMIPPKIEKNRWKKAAERLENEAFLSGRSEEAVKLVQKFRSDPE